MALPHTMDEEEGEGDGLDLQPAVPEDVQAVMVAAEEGNASALSRALGEKKNENLVFPLQLALEILDLPSFFPLLLKPYTLNPRTLFRRIRGFFRRPFVPFLTCQCASILRGCCDFFSSNIKSSAI
jgi:hypothetical protein